MYRSLASVQAVLQPVLQSEQHKQGKAGWKATLLQQYTSRFCSGLWEGESSAFDNSMHMGHYAMLHLWHPGTRKPHLAMTLGLLGVLSPPLVEYDHLGIQSLFLSSRKVSAHSWDSGSRQLYDCNKAQTRQGCSNSDAKQAISRPHLYCSRHAGFRDKGAAYDCLSLGAQHQHPHQRELVVDGHAFELLRVYEVIW